MSEERQQPMPPIPQGMTRSEFGSRVMAWGTGNSAALARMQTITAEWLIQYGVTLSMLEIWFRFYEQVYAENPENPSAMGRAELVRHCLSLLRGRG